MDSGVQYNVRFDSTGGRDHNNITQYGVQNVYNLPNNDLKQEILREFSTVDPEVVRTRILASKDVLLEGSCDWVLEDRAFTSWWEREEKSNILWIHGDPGKGKTMIFSALVEEMSQRLRPKSNGTSGLAYFFCQRTDIQLNTAAAVVNGLIYSLMRQCSAFMNYMLEHHHPKKETRGTGAGDSFWSSWTLLESFLKNITNERVYLCIDALDECATDMILLLDSITRAQHQNVQWLLTSRNEQPIRERLEFAGYGLHASLELNAGHVDKTVERFINFRVEAIARQKRYSTELKDKVFGHLQNNAQGTFLWVALVCKALDNMPRWVVNSKLGAFPAGLESLYEQMLQRIKELEDRDHRDLCLKLLRAAVVALRPLTLLDIAVYGDLPMEITDDSQSVEELISQCGSFLIVREGRVYFAHQSATDFLRNNSAYLLFETDITEGNAKFANKSLHLMSTLLTRNICRVNDPGTLVSELPKERIENSIPSHLQYACSFGLLHTIYARWPDQQYLPEIQDGSAWHSFFKTHLLHWVEALAWIQQIDSAISSIHDLLNRINSHQNMSKSNNLNELSALVLDADRFLAEFRTLIEPSPLQIYCSALVFAPSNSIVKATFRHEGPAFLKRWPSVEENWHAYLRSFDCQLQQPGLHAQVSLNTAGNLVASSNIENSRGLVHLWDTNNGNMLARIELGQSAVAKAMAFSKDSELLAIGFKLKEGSSLRSQLLLWNIENKTMRQVFQISNHRGGDFIKILFLPDNSFVVSIFDDGLVHRGPLAHRERVKAEVPFYATVDSGSTTHDSPRIILGSLQLGCDILAVFMADSTIEHWDLSKMAETPFNTPFTSKLTKGATESPVKFPNPFAPVLPDMVAFSQDLNKLVTCLGSEVRLWYRETGNTITLDRFEVGRVTCMALSPDDRVLACGAGDGDISVWNMSNGLLKGLYNAYEMCHMNAVSFASASGIQTLASASSNGTVKLWNTEVVTTYKKTCLEDEIKESSVAESVCTKYFASGSDRGNIAIWDIASGTLETSFATEPMDVTCLQISHSGSLLIIGYQNGLIWLWDVINDRCRTKFGDRSLDRSNPVRSMAFSPDEGFFASWTRERNLSIRDTVNGQLRCEFTTENSDDYPLICFSVDNKLIAVRTAVYNCNMQIEIWSVPLAQCLSIVDTGVAYILPRLSLPEVMYFSQDGTLVHLDGLKEGDPALEACIETYDIRSKVLVKRETMPYSESAPDVITSIGALTDGEIVMNVSKTWICVAGKSVIRIPKSYTSTSIRRHAIVGDTIIWFWQPDKPTDFLVLDMSRLSSW